MHENYKDQGEGEEYMIWEFVKRYKILKNPQMKSRLDLTISKIKYLYSHIQGSLAQSSELKYL